jgi:hypothetical protein
MPKQCEHTYKVPGFTYKVQCQSWATHTDGRRACCEGHKHFFPGAERMPS